MSTDHVVIDMRAQVLRCERCGMTEPLGLPRLARELVTETEWFLTRHQGCSSLPPPPLEEIAWQNLEHEATE